MRFQLARRVGVFVEIVPVGLAVAEQAMHHRAGERRVGAGLHQHREIGLLHGAVHVDVDRDDLGAALLAGARRVRHHVDLGVDRIGAPDHHQIGLRHLARIGAGDLAGAGGKADVGAVDADGGVEAGIFLGVAQPVDAVAHHQAHGAGVVVRPHRFARRSALRRRGISRRPDRARRPRRSARMSPSPSRRVRISGRVSRSGMMHALGVARDLGADHAGGVGDCPRRRGRARWCARRAPRSRARRSTDSRADRPTARSGSEWAEGERLDSSPPA